MLSIDAQKKSAEVRDGRSVDPSGIAYGHRCFEGAVEMSLVLRAICGPCPSATIVFRYYPAGGMFLGTPAFDSIDSLMYLKEVLVSDRCITLQRRLREAPRPFFMPYFGMMLGAMD